MFRATMCLSSGVTTVFMRHLAFVTLCAYQTVTHTEWQIQGCWWVLMPTRKETSYSDRRFWVSCILFLIIIGGMLVLFIYITRLASNEIFSPSNKIHREVGRAKDLSAPLYWQGCWKVRSLTRKEISYSDRRFWVSYILFLIIIGGILVRFIYITRLASNEILSASNKMHREVGRVKNLSVPLYQVSYR